jgi:hypothetical protein
LFAKIEHHSKREREKERKREREKGRKGEREKERKREREKKRKIIIYLDLVILNFSKDLNIER